VTTKVRRVHMDNYPANYTDLGLPRQKGFRRKFMRQTEVLLLKSSIPSDA
jgi:hypothetical protein